MVLKLDNYLIKWYKRTALFIHAHIAVDQDYYNFYNATTSNSASAIKNCCNVAVGDHHFSINKNSSGVYTIIDLCGQRTTVQGYCDTVTDGGGWLVVQRRKDGSEDFNRFWWEYEMGFGDLNREFWYGLKAMHCLTNQGQWELRIDYKFANGTRRYLYYKNFKIGPPSSQYQLTISG